MKYLVFFPWLLIISLPAKAQIESGRWQLGAELNQLNYEELVGNQTNLRVLTTPSIGYFLTRNLVIGVGIPLGIRSTTDPIPIFRDTHYRVGVAPSLRYYFGKSNWKPFLSLSYNYLSNKHIFKVVDDQYTYTDHSNVFIPSIGVSYRLGYRIALTTSLNYVIDNFRLANNEPRNVTITFPGIVIEDNRNNQRGLSIGVGILFFFKNI